uniref:Serpin domain-containing protein n=1 Tax=Ananas comosus var. bracteatus TaxID=296719 RepID=A0A6V7QDZ0_ANACO|nr:unnamed protein product [Ananas comosus var. bracteatus]
MDLRESIAHQTAFSLRLAKSVATAEAASSNLAFSPLSLHALLCLVAAGSKGQTLDQLVSFLGSGAAAAAASAADAADLTALASQVVEIVLADASAVGGPRVAFANGVWIDGSLSSRTRSSRSSPPLTRRRPSRSISKPRLESSLDLTALAVDSSL